MAYDWKQELIDLQQREEKRQRLLEMANAMRSQRLKSVDSIVSERKKF